MLVRSERDTMDLTPVRRNVCLIKENAPRWNLNAQVLVKGHQPNTHPRFLEALHALL